MDNTKKTLKTLKDNQNFFSLLLFINNGGFVSALLIDNNYHLVLIFLQVFLAILYHFLCKIM